MTAVASHPLAELLDEVREKFGPEYGSGLTNHLPMVLAAHLLLDANVDDTRAFIDSYATRLEPADDLWRASARKASHDARRDGVAKTVSETLARNAENLGAAAFHGIIRLRFAAATTSETEVGHAVAYWDSADAIFAGLAKAPPGDLPFEDALGALAELFLVAPALPSIRARMGALIENPDVRGIVTSLAPGGSDDDFQLLARYARDLYVAHDDFSSLHALTGAEATIALLGFDGAPRERLYRALAQAILVVAALVGDREVPSIPPHSAGWDDIAKLAIAATDDHVAKLVVALRTLGAASGDDTYRALAALRAARGHA